MRKPFTIGITGGSGSGKTYFLEGLAQHFTDRELCLLAMDHYYKPISEQSEDKNGVINFDIPEAIDRDLFIKDILKLKAGEVVTKQEYTFNNPKITPNQLSFTPAPILVIEGLFVQYFEEVNNELDLRIFIEAKDHVKLGRRIRRDQTERGYDLEDVLYRYEYHTMPVYEQHIEPLKHNADFVIPNNGDLNKALEVVTGYLRSILAGLAN